MLVFVLPAVLCLVLKQFVVRKIGAGMMTVFYCVYIWSSDPWPEELLGLLPAAVLAYWTFAIFCNWTDQRRIASNKTPCGRIARHPAPAEKSPKSVD